MDEQQELKAKLRRTSAMVAAAALALRTIRKHLDRIETTQFAALAASWSEMVEYVTLAAEIFSRLPRDGQESDAYDIAYNAAASTLANKALRFDLDEAGIERREAEAVELIELRARVSEQAERIRDLAGKNDALRSSHEDRRARTANGIAILRDCFTLRADCQDIEAAATDAADYHRKKLAEYRELSEMLKSRLLDRVPDGTGICYLSQGYLIVLGFPGDEDETPEEERHNCDAMGCSSAGMHVVERQRLSTEHMARLLAGERVGISEIIPPEPTDGRK